MTHVNEDQLLAFALEVVETERERAGIAAHLETCPECSARLDAIKADIGTISGVRPTVSASEVLQRGQRLSAVRTGERRAYRFPGYALLRAAAFVAVGVLAGFGAASRIRPETVVISPVYVEMSPLPASEGTAASDATSIPAGYYDSILEQVGP